MQEHQLEVVLDIIPDPEKNVYKVKKWKDINEILRIVTIFNIKKEQKINHLMLSVEQLASLKVRLSNN